MAMGRPKAELVLSEEEQAQLQSIARSRSLPAALVRRANIVLACAAGETNSAVARRFGTTNATVGKWRRRFIARRIEGLHDELRPGKPRTIDDERMAELINTTLHAKPKDGATHWSVRGVGRRDRDLQDQRASLLQAVRAAAPSQRQLQAVDRSVLHREAARRGRAVSRTRPTRRWCCASTRRARSRRSSAPSRCCRMGFGYVEGVTHDYHRHGTTTLFAALNVLDGAVLAAVQARAIGIRSSSASCARSSQAVPADLDIHSSSTTTPPTSIPRSRPGSPRGRAGTSTSSRPTAPGSTRSSASSPSSPTRPSAAARSTRSRDLVAKIDHFVTHYNQTCKPFVWTATADSILAKLHRLCSRINGTEH